MVQERNQIINISNIKLLPPISKPDKVICVGLNYKGHCDEQNKPFPEQPFFFSKFPSTIIGPTDNILHPPNSKAGNNFPILINHFIVNTDILIFIFLHRRSIGKLN